MPATGSELQRSMAATSAPAGTCWTLLTRQGGLIWRMHGKRSQLALGMGLETLVTLHHRMQLPLTRPVAPEHGPVRCAIPYLAVHTMFVWQWKGACHICTEGSLNDYGMCNPPARASFRHITQRLQR